MIDWDQVKSLRDDVGHDSFPEIIEIFLEEVEEVMLRLRTAPTPDTLGDDLHFLKGSALNLGFRDFSNLCQQGEASLAAGMAQDVDLTAIDRTFEQSKAQFDANLVAALKP